MNESNILSINFCNGGIYKTYKESWFIRFSLNSNIASILLGNDDIYKYGSEISNMSTRDSNKYYYGGRISGEKVVVLQIVNFDSYCIAEIITEEDLDNYLKNKI